jgi:hypothetical protein
MFLRSLAMSRRCRFRPYLPTFVAASANKHARQTFPTHFACRKFFLDKMECTTCGGSGKTKCKAAGCNGKGLVKTGKEDSFSFGPGGIGHGSGEQRSQCLNCKGMKVADCTSCNGKGHLTGKKLYGLGFFPDKKQ